MSLTGPSATEPTKVGVPIADLLAGMYGATGVLAALHERERTGRGQIVRTSLLAAVVGVHSYQGTRYTVAGEVPAPTGRYHRSICPYGLFDCADGAVQIAVGSDGLWRRFAPTFDLDRPEWLRNAQRVADGPAVVAAVTAAFSGYGKTALLRLLADLGIPAGSVSSLDEVYSAEQTRSQGLLIEVEHATLGSITLPGPPLRFESGGFASGRSGHEPPPTLGQHNDSIRAWLDDPL